MVGTVPRFMRAAGAPTAAPGRHASTYQGVTWEGLGIILGAPPGSEACDSSNRFVLGGVGDRNG